MSEFNSILLIVERRARYLSRDGAEELEAELRAEFYIALHEGRAVDLDDYARRWVNRMSERRWYSFRPRSLQQPIPGLDGLLLGDVIPSRGAMPEDSLLAKEEGLRPAPAEYAVIQTAMSYLPERLRWALTECAEGDRPHADIAADRGLAPSTFYCVNGYARQCAREAIACLNAGREVPRFYAWPSGATYRRRRKDRTSRSIAAPYPMTAPQRACAALEARGLDFQGIVWAETYREIALELGCTEGAVMTAVGKARKIAINRASGRLVNLEVAEERP